MIISLTIAGLLAMGLGGPLAPAAAAPAKLRTDLNVLVINGSETTPYQDLMNRDGIRFSTANASSLSAGFLADTSGSTPRAKFQGVVVPSLSALTTAQWTTLRSYAGTYGVRILVAVASPNSSIGMNAPTGGLTMDGVAATVTPAGQAGAFSYLKGPVSFPDIDPAVSEVWATPSTPLNPQPAGTVVTPLVTTGGANVLVGVHSVTGAGTLQETMFVTFAGNAGQLPFQVLGPGILNWLTQGTHLGLTRNYLSVHIDDVLSADARWSVTDNCTPGEDCTVATVPPEIVMSAADVSALLNWQQSAGVKLDMAYNAGLADTPALTAALLANRGALRWINHSYNHLYYGCAQVSSPPYNCTTQNPVTSWVPTSTIVSDIESNITWAANNGVTIDRTELISGEHSGLGDTNPGRVQGDSPNFLSALDSLGIKVTASDSSKGSAQRTLANSIGTKALPRYPNAIYYNVATEAEAADEYNWIYGPNDGTPTHQGNCTAVAGVTTCMASLLDQASGFDSYIAPFVARETLGRVLSNDPRPHFTHQSNIAETTNPSTGGSGGGLVYTWLDLVLNGGGSTIGYKQMVNDKAPIVNPTMTQASLVLTQQADWAAKKGNVTGYILNGQAIVTNSGGTAVWVPLSADQSRVAGTWGEAYQGTRSAWTQLSPGQTLKVDIGANLAPVASFTSSCSVGKCTFTSTSTDVDSEVSSFAYLWEFGDGTTATTGPTATRSYANGTYPVRLTVTDARGGVGTATQTVTITDSPNKEVPVAVADIVSCNALTCTFDASRSSDPDGIASYAWDFGDGSTGTGARVEHTFPSGGEFSVRLVVTDGQGASSSTSVVARAVAPKRANQAPHAAFTVSCQGLTCGTNASASSDPDGSIVSYQWTFGDGTGAAGVNPLGHVFPAAGTYTITLTVYDNEGAAASATQKVTVAPATIVKAKAVSKQGKLKVDVDPNLKGSKYWKISIQKKNPNGTWSTLKKTYKTQGKKETRTINLKKGTYRVLSQPKYGYGTGISGEVTLKK